MDSNCLSHFSYLTHMLTKEKVISAINKMPSQFSIEDIMDELLFIDKIEKGLSQSKTNDVISDQELDKELPEWLR